MKFERHLNPNYIRITNVFDETDVGMIYNEAMSHKEKFIPAGVGKAAKQDANYRNNLYCDYDNLYKKREESPLLKGLAGLMNTKAFTSCMTSFCYPFYDFTFINRIEHQVSSYSKNQYYKWHFDTFLGSKQRLLTVIYFFHKMPRKFQGGSFQLLDCPLLDREPLDPDLEPVNIEPENNTAIVISCNQAHRVMPILNEVSFEESRFSCNMWIGIDSKMQLINTIGQ